MILAIESSCDESALALFSEKEGIIGEWIYSQLDLHKEYGGVVPSLASREHLKAFGPLLEKTLKNIKEKNIEKIAVTYGPGLAGCLAMGLSLGKALALSLNIPLYGINHLRGHVYSPFINLHQKSPEEFKQNFQKLLPHLGLLISGGNTLLFEINKKHEIKILAQTVDDAAGEALDKGAKLLGMPYPGGAIIEKVAFRGDKNAIKFPQSFPDADDMQFSFSGLKTSLRYYLEKINDAEFQKELPNICASYQEAVIQALMRKLSQGFEKSFYSSIGLSGGVSNNKYLRTLFTQFAQEKGIPSYIAEPKHTGDNAGMIAFAAYADPENAILDSHYKLSFNPSVTLVNLKTD
ncbi:MAG: tRNA (adenosine(37)-N6)-threonylcarbamoyltransferase complex transferase subunit TsaD [Verrucomicrobia bacterium]|nr:MAG: tRNA (adenosine(37)-N6)-threonylcarbamoyltransferase complex transferase subunit TsaD [Verrucomicrobiota bacterium]